MRLTGCVLVLLFIGVLSAQEPAQQTALEAAASESVSNPVFVCPMDPDIRSHNPGNCSRCGMKMLAGIPDPVEFHLNLTVTPRAPRPGDIARLIFEVHDPWKNNVVKNFQLVHEKFFHAFIISQDLQVFIHDHPTLHDDGDFHYELAFPQAGMYRVLGDFYPDGATPQLITKTIIVPGKGPEPPELLRDYSQKDSENLHVELVTIPPQPIAGKNTQMRFQIAPVEGLEKYLGTWGHMLAASDDLIDMVHLHPFIADGGPEIQFNMVFPRPRPYRVWVQFQRDGVVNTVHFDIPVKELGN